MFSKQSENLDKQGKGNRSNLYQQSEYIVRGEKRDRKASLVDFFLFFSLFQRKNKLLSIV